MRRLSQMNNVAKNFGNYLCIKSLNVLHNYFDNQYYSQVQTKLFSDLYLAKFLDISAKLFLPRINYAYICYSFYIYKIFFFSI